NLDSPLRFTNAGAEITSNGETYVHFPFDVVLVADQDDVPRRARLIIDNTDRQIVTAVETLRPWPQVQIQTVLASNPDVIEISYPPLPLKDIQGDVFTIEGWLSAADLTTEPYPGDTLTPGL